MENKDKQTLKAGSFYYSDGTYSNELDEIKTCIGVCVIPPNFLPDGKARIMSLKEMDYNNPENGSLKHVYLYWGQSGIDTTINNQTTFTTVDQNAIDTYEGTTIGSNEGYGYLPSNRQDISSWVGAIVNNVDKGTKWYYNKTTFLPSPYMKVNGKEVLCPEYNSGALSDFDGKGNTAILTKLHTIEDWKMVDKITNRTSSNYSPAAVCCSRYKTEGTNSGDWYLPVIGELGFIMARFNEIQNSLHTLGSNTALPLGVINSSYWSSSECDSSYVFIWNPNRSCFSYGCKYGYSFVRAFLMV